MIIYPVPVRDLVERGMEMAIILFDGVCNFCDRSVQFIIRHDKRKVFQFASLQSETGIELLAQYRLQEEIDSIVLIDDRGAFTESDAIIRISSELRFPYSLGSSVGSSPAARCRL